MTDRKAVSVGEQTGAIRALAMLTTRFPYLPSDTITIGPTVSAGGVEQGIRIDLHTSFADFEVWRVALGIEQADVQHREMTTVQTLSARAVFSDVPIELTAYMPRFAIAAAEAA